MSIQEKRIVLSLVTTVLFMGGFIFYTFGINGEQNLPHVEELQFWGEFMLVMMGVTIAFKIAAHIIFTIIVARKHKGEDLEFMDDYDKRIEMRSDRYGSHIFILGFITSMIPIAMGKPVYYMFIIFLIGGVTSGIVGDLLKLYYYKKGINL